MIKRRKKRVKGAPPAAGEASYGSAVRKFLSNIREMEGEKYILLFGKGKSTEICMLSDGTWAAPKSVTAFFEKFEECVKGGGGLFVKEILPEGIVNVYGFVLGKGEILGLVPKDLQEIFETDPKTGNARPGDPGVRYMDTFDWEF